MSGAIAVILFLGGVQIPLPSPAVVMEGQSWVPLRAVFEDLGYEVGWDAPAGAVKLGAQGRADVLLRVGQTKVEQGQKVYELSAAPRRIEGTIYVPAQLLHLVAQAQLHWDNKQKALYVTALPAGAVASVTIGDILANPPAWANKLVTIAAEYTGWQGDPFSPATAAGPPVSRSDWTVRDATGSIYCTADQLKDTSIALQPYSELGRRIALTGGVRIARQGFPYLQVQRIEGVSGLTGITCYLTTDRRRYQSGDTVVMQMQIGNPTTEPIELQFTSSQTYDFVVRSLAGQELWRWSAGKMFAQALQQRTLGPQETYVVEERWTIPPDEGENVIQPGLYKVEGRITRDMTSYAHTIQIHGRG